MIILAASAWSKEHNPANKYNLWDALHAGTDPDPEPGPEPDTDMEAEP